jgi:hypothetical protein
MRSLVRRCGGDILFTMTESEATAASPRKTGPSPLRAAVHQARIEAAERTGVVVDLKDAELARLDLLNEALEPVFADIPHDIAVFDRAITSGEPPRLWIDMVAHVVMGRDKRVYRFLQDTRYGRRVLAESAQVGDVVVAVTQYVARRLVERERALSGDAAPRGREAKAFAAIGRRRWRGRLALFLLGMLAGAATLLAIAWFLDPLVY